MSVSTVRLADVATKIGSGITPRGGSAVYKTAGRPFIRSQNVGWGDLRLADMAYIDEATHSNFPATEIRTGDVLLNITGASIGRSAVATPALNGGNVNQHVCEIRLNPGRMDPRFLNAFLLSRSGQSQIDMFQAGGNRQGLNFRQVGSIQVPDLPIEQQREIGSVSQNTDDLIATLDRLIAKKQAIKQGMMQQLLTGRTRLPGFSRDWVELRAGDLGTFKGGSGFAPRYQGAASGPIPFFKVSDMNNEGNELFMRRANNYITESQRKSMAAALMPAEAIVFAKVGAAVFLERKRILTIPSCIDNNMAAYVVDKERVDVRFMHYLLSDFPMSSLVATGALPSLNGGQLRSIPISLPFELDEQRAIAVVLADCDAEIRVHQARLAKARDTKTGMMQQLLTGRIRLPVEAAS
ncbi:MAG: restriction endonuclease subunit S [Solirubrobacterales bacterium]|nr:restriction endonuclease subunit S [Solirubrobacterales bacterium]